MLLHSKSCMRMVHASYVHGYLDWAINTMLHFLQMVFSNFSFIKGQMSKGTTCDA